MTTQAMRLFMDQKLAKGEHEVVLTIEVAEPLGQHSELI